MASLDGLGRPLRNLRLSVTDRCNLRCQYCMPEEDYIWLPREDLFSFEEMALLVDIFADVGVHKVRITGGEPLLRRDLPRLVRILAPNPRLHDLAMTTNGVLLAGQAEALKEAGLQRLTVSLDTLQPDRFLALTRLRRHADVLEGIDLVSRLFGELKIDSVVMRGVNDDELSALIEFGKSKRAEVRFIEYMDVGGATLWSNEKVVSREQILDAIGRHYGRVEPIVEDSTAPAQRFRLPDGTLFGVIASTTAPFCRSCDRSRITADGLWYLCLYGARGIDLRRLVRGGASRDEIRQLIEATWAERTERGAERRLEERNRRAFVPLAALRNDPHLEMHTRGG